MKKDFNFVSFVFLEDKKYCLNVRGLDIDTKENIWLILSYFTGASNVKKLKENKDGKLFKKGTEVSLDYCINILGISELN